MCLRIHLPEGCGNGSTFDRGCQCVQLTVYTNAMRPDLGCSTNSGNLLQNQRRGPGVLLQVAQAPERGHREQHPQAGSDQQLIELLAVTKRLQPLDSALPRPDPVPED